MKTFMNMHVASIWIQLRYPVGYTHDQDIMISYAKPEEEFPVSIFVFPRYGDGVERCPNKKKHTHTHTHTHARKQTRTHTHTSRV